MFIGDLHIHSKFSRATSKDCDLEHLALAAKQKGLDMIGTGDFTHPQWRRELKEKLLPWAEGLYVLGPDSPRFMVTGEISTIYKKNGKTRKVHHLICLPSLEAAETLSLRLEQRGFNLHSDGRPIMGLDSRDLLEMALEAAPQALLIPAHIWTPHFSLFGAYSGFDDIQECYEDLAPYIYALETGLSSDPAMIRRVSMLDRFTLVSNSDAHSPGNLAREANLFDTQCSYPAIYEALKDPEKQGFLGTIEFFPEEGKYHFDGHRNCHVCQSPEQTIQSGGICPVCGKKLTLGVAHRVEELADREAPLFPANSPCYESLVPLKEMIAACMGFSAKSQKGSQMYRRLVEELGGELDVLRKASLSDIQRLASPVLAMGIENLRAGRLLLTPGYDGEYGKVNLLNKRD